MGENQNTISQGLGWDFFDAIYCITLDSRPDRMAAAEAQFALAGLAGRVKFLVVARDEEDPARGIYESHQRCLSLGLAAGAQHILIFEDDIFFRGCDHQLLDHACRFLQETNTWDAFFLGCLTNGSRPTGQDGVVRIQYRCLAHAYALNRPFAERIAQRPWQGIPIDGLLQAVGGNFFALRPMCGFQGRASSDNKTVWLNRLRSLCGGLPLIQLGNELYQNNKKILILLHLAAVVAIVLFLLACL
ncbi:MAG: glycosyltransferase [Proteobacteria bacterium]|nr:glycosyltransferase [Pseudomonadota bacterium]